MLLDTEGEGDTFTDGFDAPENWELRWEVEGDGPFIVELFTEDDVSRGTIVNAGEENEGSTFVSERGRFYLLISTEKHWDVKVMGVRR